jgi:hypothetical protein
MINPNGDDFVEDDPLAASGHAAEELGAGPLEGGFRRRRGQPSATGDKWEQSKARLNDASRRTGLFLRENPVPTVLSALAFGLAIGWVLRHATREEKEIEIKTPLGEWNWSFLSLPFVWPFLKSAREKYEDSADAVKEGVDRLRKIDVDRYTKPVRKRWDSWTR